MEFDAGEEETDSGAFDRAKDRFRQIVVPFSVPILAGPGSIVTATLFGFRSDDYFERATLAVLLAAIMLAVFGILLAGRHIQAVLGDLVLNVQSRIWGLLLTAIAAQMIMVGLADAFPAWIDAGSPVADDVQQQSESTRSKP